MPNLNGAELIRRFRAVAGCGDVPAVVVTAYEDVQFRTLALEAGANDFLLSPIDHGEFCTQSRKLLSMRHAAQTNSLSPSDPAAASEEASAGQTEMFNSLVETIGGKLLHKTDELQRTISEMQSLLEGSRTAAIFVDENLLIRRYTAEAAAIYDISPGDVGRPLNSLRSQLVYDTLEQDFHQVVQTCLGIDRYIEHSTTRKHYLLRIIPNQFQHRAKLGATLIFSKLGVWHGGNDHRIAH